MKIHEIAWKYLSFIYCSWFRSLLLPRVVQEYDKNASLQRLSEMSSLAVSQLLMYGKSIISNANKVQEEGVDKDIMKIDWPEDSVEKAKIIRREAQSMAGYVEGVCNSFITG